MDNTSTELVLLESRTARTTAISKISDDSAIEVLNKAKALIMAVWQGAGVATNKQLAEYFEVDIDAIESALRRNRDEFEQDGLKILKGKDIESVSASSTETITGKRLTVWTPRATLRLGMLLRDSLVAKKLRSTILDVVETAKPAIVKPEKPRLQIITKKRTLRKHIAHGNAILGLVPGLSDTRKSVLLLSSIVTSFPEEAELVALAQSILPSLPATEQSYTPTEIGKKLNPALSAVRVNLLLEQAGLQTSYLTAREQKKWQATELGCEYSVITIEAKQNGAPTESLRWKASVIELISIRQVV